jgi:hypothetical protein
MRPTVPRRVAQVVGLAALGGTLFPPLAFLAGLVDLDVVKWILALCTVAWFAAAPWWMKVE